jgi:hypothetical protein
MINRSVVGCQIELKLKDTDPGLAEVEDAGKRLSGLEEPVRQGMRATERLIRNQQFGSSIPLAGSI